MRQIVLDTETTGLESKDGHRIIEIGCIEVVDRRVTEQRLHHYVNPQRESEAGALAVHGLSTEFLADKPLFPDIVDDLLDFVRDAEVIIHNAPFDIAFLDAELGRIGRGNFADHCAKITDSLTLAREQHPGKRNSLDALCDRYQVSNAHRTLHGALLDAGLLADVFLAMTRGQDSLAMDFVAEMTMEIGLDSIDISQLIVLMPNEAEIVAHEAALDAIEKQSKSTAVWRRAESVALH